MGVMEDTGMPAGLTFAGRGWDDARLLALAAAFESLGTAEGGWRQAPTRTPDLGGAGPLPGGGLTLTVQAGAVAGEARRLAIGGTGQGVRVSVNGREVAAHAAAGGFAAAPTVPVNRHRHSEHQPPWGDIVIATAGAEAAMAEVPAAEA
jgi:amidase